MVDILTLADGYMIGHQLQRNRGNQRFQALQGVRQFNHLVGYLGNRVVALANQGDYPTLAGLDFLNVGEHLLVHIIMSGNDHHWHVRINQCNGAVLHLGGRIALGVDIRDFLQFQGALQGYRIAEAATEIEEIARIGERTAQVGNTLVELEHFLHLRGNLTQFLHDFLIVSLRHHSFLFTQGKCKHRQDSHLTGECLRGSHTNLGAHVDIGTGVRCSWDAGANSITNTIDECTLTLSQLNGSQCISRLTTLRDCYHHITLTNDGIAIAKF